LPVTPSSKVAQRWCQDYELAKGQNDVNIDKKALNDKAIDEIVLRLK
jgi:hypothetical protein